MAESPPMPVRVFSHTRAAGPAEERSDFAETLFWHPVLVLPDGKTAVSFDLCDSLGSFEGACARAFTLAGRTPRRFELHPFGLPRRRLPLLSLLRQALAPAVYALWWPVWTGPGLGGSEDFGTARE